MVQDLHTTAQLNHAAVVLQTALITGEHMGEKGIVYRMQGCAMSDERVLVTFAPASEPPWLRPATGSGTERTPKSDAAPATLVEMKASLPGQRRRQQRLGGGGAGDAEDAAGICVLGHQQLHAGSVQGWQPQRAQRSRIAHHVTGREEQKEGPPGDGSDAGQGPPRGVQRI